MDSEKEKQSSPPFSFPVSRGHPTSDQQFSTRKSLEKVGRFDLHGTPVVESVEQFETRKKDHIALALDAQNEALGHSGFDQVRLWHEALPEMRFSDIEISTQILGQKRRTPFLVSSMTAGHGESLKFNQLLAQACAEQGWFMGVGSQRRELNDPEARKEWQSVRKHAPQVGLLGNLGLAQLISTTNEQVSELVEALEAEAMIIHLNPLQECLQPEGTPHFQGGIVRLQKLAEFLSIPVIVKETGCGFSPATLRRLSELPLGAIDVSGYGGTHWGRIEGQRSPVDSLLSDAAQTFANWGVNTVDSLRAAQDVGVPFEVWASGGLRSGLDAGKALALGAQCVGFAKPILQAATKGYEELLRKMQTLEFELRTLLFCTGCKNIGELRTKKVIR